MSLSNAPWLEGLDGTSTWKPKPAQQQIQPSSVTHSAGSLVNKQTRIPRRSLSGASYSSIRKARSPLATLDKNEHNSTIRKEDVSELDGSIVVRGTIQQRAKSSSPGKREATLEWRKRLLNNKVGYGDQTDLFGPSGLENIFASNGGEPRSEGAPRSGNLSWLPRSDANMPSSPPPWPNNLRAGPQRLAELRLSSDAPDNMSQQADERQDSSVVSNPFELDSAVDDKLKEQSKHAVSGVDRIVSGPTMLEQEDFSPVILSRHTTVSGTIGYVPIKSDEKAMLSSTHAEPVAAVNKALLHVKKASHTPTASDSLDPSVFTDGPSSAVDGNQSHDLSLSENLPAGTPESLDRNVQVKRGGYSTMGSFKHRPLSMEPSAVSQILPDETSELFPPAPSPPQRHPLPQLAASSRLQELIDEAGSSNDTSEAGESELNAVPLKSFAVRQTSFGDGQLNGHTFEAEVQHAMPSTPARQLDGSDGSPGSDVAVPGSRIPMTFQSQNIQSSSHHKSYPRLPSKAEQTPHPKAILLGKRTADSVEDLKSSTLKTLSEHKRLPPSPLKDSTPKRRRTLHASELALDSINQTRQASTALHREVIQSHFSNSTESDTASRPRNPTPSQCAIESILPADIQEATDDFLAQEDRSAVEDVLERVEQSMSDADSDTFREQAEVVAAEVAKYTIKINKSAESNGYGERKKSVTTQDFFREAELVMEYIRARAAKKPSQLASVEETENMEAQLDQTSNLQVPKGSTRSDEYMRVSREPSWENRPRSRWREPEQLRLQRDGVDIGRVASQLRKWKEPESTDEQDVFLAEPAATAESGEHSSSEVVYDERARIRITGPSSEYAQVIDGGSQPQSQRSQASSNSTRRTENVGTLAPDAVAHLIGSEVGGMTYDKDKQQWVRIRSPEHRAIKNGFLDVLESHLTSEDDPFREISDLAVDEGVEQRRISSPVRIPLSDKTGAQVEDVRTTSNDSAQTVKQLSVSTTVLQQPAQSTTGVPFWTGLDPTTAPTSLDGKTESETSQVRKTKVSISKVMHVIDDAEAQADAGKKFFHPDDAASDGKNTSTSAPEAHLLSRLREDTIPGNDVSDLSDLHSSRLRPSAPAALDISPFPKPNVGHPLHNLPVLSAAQEARDISEVSFVAPLPGDRLVSVSLSVSKPAVHKQLGRILEQESSPSRYQSSLVLSDLPDFTVHQDDPERPSERALAERFAHHAAIEVNDRFAVATKELVRALTDLYPEEPFWQELHDLDMHNRSLISLHGLDSFCDNIRGLDISKNRLTHLHGVPGSVRRLTAAHNQLSSLTSFVHLGNLQYVNVSGNGLRSLDVFAACVHLRELVADDNDICTLDGIAHLDLLKLRCRRNHIQQLRFAGGESAALTSLDLSHCRVESIDGLHHLVSLEHLSLNGNKLVNGFLIDRIMPSLQHLSLKDCNLTTLDVSNLPNLRTLLVDDNSLTSINGLDKLQHLNVLSMQRQQLALGDEIDIFNQRLEAETIRLSGNKLTKLCIGTDQLSLKHLDLAAVGLNDLPSDIGLRMPNLRSLNLNFNSMKSIKPLLHMHGLDCVQLYGNRLSRLRKTAAVLKKLPKLQIVDLRDNPVSQGFYAPAALQPQSRSTAVMLRDGSPQDIDEDVQQEELDWNLYNVPEQDADRDQKHIDRLDDETRLRRRVYDMLLAHSCPRLQELDGLPFVKASALRKDLVWHRLIELGVVRKATM